MAFHFVRFADTQGQPRCPSCNSAEVSYTKSRPRYRCKQCHGDFSLTSGTMLHHRKMGLRSYLSLLSLLIDRSQFRSLNQFSQSVGMDYKTAWVQAQKFRVASTDEDGCTVPFSLLSRSAWTQRAKFLSRGNITDRFMPSTREAAYPYLRKGNRDEEGAELLSFVNSIIPKGLPDYMRADIGQDMILSILSGEATRQTLKSDQRAYLTRLYREFPWKYKWVSFDAPFGGDDDRGSLHDVISEDEAKEAYLYW